MNTDLVSTDRRVVLRELQRQLASAIEAAEPREMAALAKQMAATVAELESMPAVEGNAVDEIAAAAARRRERDAAAAAGAQ